jgi:hypothetical protein
MSPEPGRIFQPETKPEGETKTKRAAQKILGNQFTGSTSLNRVTGDWLETLQPRRTRFSG